MRFKNDIEIERRPDGVIGMDDDTKESYYLLLSEASVKDLVKYTDDSIPFIRTQIFIGLAQKTEDIKILERISDAHKNDSTEFASKGADVVTTWRVNEFMQTVLRMKREHKLKQIDYKERIRKLKENADMSLQIEGVRHSRVDKEKIERLESLFFKTNKFRVLSFQLYVNDWVYNASDNKLTKEMKLAIQKTIPGDVLYFDEIKVLVEEGGTRLSMPITLMIK